MRIVIDMQGAQSESRHHCIGRYSIVLAQAMVRHRGEHEIILALNGLFFDTIEHIRAAFHDLLPQASIRVWYATGPVHECEPVNAWRRDVAERIRECFLASLRPDLVFIPSFFEGYEDDGVISIGLFAQNLTTVVAINRLDATDTDSANPGVNIFTLRKLEHLKRANLLLALSPLNKDEVYQRLEIPQERVKAGLMVGEAGTNLHEAITEAKNLLNIFEEITAAPQPSLRLPQSPRPKMAYISPLPPERSGISDYSAELLPELARFYDIDVIVAQEKITTPWITTNCGVRTADWLLENSHCYSRVLYHFGNSPYHQHMFNLLAHIPGVVVLHDFYLGDIHYYLEKYNIIPFALTRALYESHGYWAVTERFRVGNNSDVVRKYPANLGVLLQAQGIIVHSEHSRHLATEWYGHGFAADWAVIPLLRTPSSEENRVLARQELGFESDDYVVCSFGLLGPTKLNHRFLEAWLNSRLARDTRCTLVFVGENDSGEYGAKLVEIIHNSRLGKRVRITGWVDMATFRNYLAAADIAVQLRTNSRGETSAAVLDCMNHSLPTIVNANGSMSELPVDTVWMLPDLFDDKQLIEALETLWQNIERRSALAKRAQEYIRSHHAPQTCAEQYFAAIEQMHSHSKSDCRSLIKAIADIDGYTPADAECIGLAQSISRTLPIRKPVKQSLIDVSVMCREDLKTGIQRVARALVLELIKAPPQEYRVEPVYLTDEGGVWHYCYARKWTSSALGILGDWIQDEPIDYSAGDLMLVADFTGSFAVKAEQAGVFTQLKNEGVALHFVVYDLLPIQMPEFFPTGSFGFVEWLNTVYRNADGAICISSTVADELRSWVKVASPQRSLPMNIGWFHLGADVENSMPTSGMPKDAEKKLAMLSAAPSFLMVGTIEPRKGYLQTLEAFTQLWQEGVDVNLVIVGNEGWKGLPNEARRTIPAIIRSLCIHPELGKRLFWFKGISDEYLEKIYEVSTCLIAASEGEGFGLPLIEAAQHNKLIIARDLPVFREVAGENAFYFSGLAPKDLAEAITYWLKLNQRGIHPKLECMNYLTWRESALQLKNQLGLSEEN